MKIVTTALVLGLMSTTSIASGVNPQFEIEKLQKRILELQKQQSNIPPAVPTIPVETTKVETKDSITVDCSADIPRGSIKLSNPPKINCEDMKLAMKATGSGYAISSWTHSNYIVKAIKHNAPINESVKTITIYCSNNISRGVLKLSNPIKVNCEDMSLAKMSIGFGMTLSADGRTHNVIASLNKEPSYLEGAKRMYKTGVYPKFSEYNNARWEQTRRRVAERRERLRQDQHDRFHAFQSPRCTANDIMRNRGGC